MAKDETTMRSKEEIEKALLTIKVKTDAAADDAKRGDPMAHQAEHIGTLAADILKWVLGDPETFFTLALAEVED